MHRPRDIEKEGERGGGGRGKIRKKRRRNEKIRKEIGERGRYERQKKRAWSSEVYTRACGDTRRERERRRERGRACARAREGDGEAG